MAEGLDAWALRRLAQKAREGMRRKAFLFPHPLRDGLTSAAPAGLERAGVGFTSALSADGYGVEAALRKAAAEPPRSKSSWRSGRDTSRVWLRTLRGVTSAAPAGLG